MLLIFEVVDIILATVYCLKMSENRKETVVIIGGGIIGLTTAYELSKKFDVHLVEKRQSV